MKCPNCGKTVRSKTRCAFCGHQFDGADHRHEVEETAIPNLNLNTAPDPIPTPPTPPTPPAPPVLEPVGAGEKDFDFDLEAMAALHEAKQSSPSESSMSSIRRNRYASLVEDDDDYDDDDELVPEYQPKRRGGFGRLLLGILQMVIVLAVVFLAFVYGPKYFGTIMDFVNEKLGNQTTANLPQAPVNVVSEVEVKEESSATIASSEQAAQPATLMAEQKVELGEYPLVKVDLTFNQEITEATSDTFKFAMTKNGEQTPITDYSLIREGKTFKLSFVDPAYELTANADITHTLVAKADSLNYSQNIEYKAPASKLDAAKVEALTKIFTELNGAAVAFQEVGAGDVITSSDKAVDASNLLSWFVIARVYAQVAENKFALTDEVEIKDQLKLQGDQGVTAQKAAGEKTSVEALLSEIVMQNDMTALNHLLDKVGGTNDFNTWLNESGYYATKVLQNLTLSAQGDLQGAQTSAYDIARLLSALAQGKLVNPQVSEDMRKLYSVTPLSAKFPATWTAIKRRTEMTSPDTVGQYNYYSAILDGEAKQFIVVILPPQGTASEAASTALAGYVEGIVAASQGEVLPAAEVATSAESTSAEAQVNVVSEQAAPAAPAAPAPEVPVPAADPNVQPPPVYDHFDDDGDGQLDPTPRLGRWYFDTAQNKWLYY